MELYMVQKSFIQVLTHQTFQVQCRITSFSMCCILSVIYCGPLANHANNQIHWLLKNGRNGKNTAHSTLCCSVGSCITSCNGFAMTTQTRVGNQWSTLNDPMICGVHYAKEIWIGQGGKRIGCHWGDSETTNVVEMIDSYIPFIFRFSL